MNYEGNGCKVWRGYNDLIGLYGLQLIMIRVRFVNIRESGFRTPREDRDLCACGIQIFSFGNRNPSSADKEYETQHLESGIHAVEFRIQDYLTWGSFGVTQGITLQLRIQGEGVGKTPLFLDQTEARKAEKEIFFVTGPPRYLRVWMTAPPPNPLILSSGSATALSTLTIPKSFPPKTSHGTKNTTNHNGN